MLEGTDANKLLSYTLTEVPLTQNDVEKLQEILSHSYQMNILLLPLLVLIYFWGILYFGIFAAFVIICNIIFTNNYLSTKHGLTKPKIVVTGIITNVRKNEETIINFGKEEFDITYANANFLMQVDDMISIHYSKKENNSRGHLLNIEIVKKLPPT